METALSRCGVSLGSLKAEYALRRTGNERMRRPVAEYMQRRVRSARFFSSGTLRHWNLSKRLA
jgi:hypothetical protein